MTTKQLCKLKHGTRVLWNGTDKGYVVDLRTSKPNAEPPLLYIQWDDGQRTDGRDVAAIQHVSIDGGSHV